MVLMDVSMPKVYGTNATREVRDLLPATAVQGRDAGVGAGPHIPGTRAGAVSGAECVRLWP